MAQKIDESVVRKVASLARLHLTDEEVKKFGEQMQAILNSFSNIAQINTDGVEPLITATDVAPYYRPDEVRQGLTAEEALAQAPARAGNSFKVPPVV